MIAGGDLPRLSECRDCHEPIRFVRMPSGRNMPVNPAPTTDTRPGLVAAALRGHTLHGYVITPDRLGGDLRYPRRFTPHYSTCAAKRTTPKPAPTQDPALF